MRYGDLVVRLRRHHRPDKAASRGALLQRGIPAAFFNEYSALRFQPQSIFATTSGMSTSARDFRPCLSCFTMRAALFTVFGCQTTATRMFTTLPVFIVHIQSFLVYRR